MDDREYRTTITLTTITRKRLDYAGERIRAVEGVTGQPSRIINELIMEHCVPHPEEKQTATLLPKPIRRRRKKKPQELRSSA